MRKALTVIQVLLLCVFVGCGCYIGKYYYDSHKSNESYEELRREIRRGGKSEATAPTTESAEYVPSGTETQTQTEAAAEKQTKEREPINLDALCEKNKDFRGWLTIDGTKVDYPVVQAKDNNYYLHRDFYGKYRYSGTPFLDCQSTESSQNFIIYAHNMKDGSMFADISKYTKKDFCRSHSKITYYTLTEGADYEIISVFRTSIGSKSEFRYYDYADIETEELYNEYVSYVKALSLYDTGAETQFGCRLLTLSTCAYNTENERLVIVARKI